MQQPVEQPWRRHEKEGQTLRYFEAIVEGVWCKETASPSCQDTWMPTNPAWGQCAVTTALLHWMYKDADIDVEIMRGMVSSRSTGHSYGSHYWIRLADGTHTDMTLRQFGNPDDLRVIDVQSRTIEYLLDSENAAKAHSRERFELLKTLYEEAQSEFLCCG